MVEWLDGSRERCFVAQGEMLSGVEQRRAPAFRKARRYRAGPRILH